MTRHETRIRHNGTIYQIEGAADFDDSGLFKRGTGWHINIVETHKGHEEIVSCGAWFETKDAAIAAVQA